MATKDLGAGVKASSVLGAPSVAAKAPFSYAQPAPVIEAGIDAKIPLVVLLFLSFSFCLYAYGQMGLDSSVLFNFAHYSAIVARVASSAALMFFLSFCLSLALAISAFRGIDWVKSALLCCAATVIPAALFGLFVFPAYLYPFLCFSSAMVFAAFFSSLAQASDKSLSSAYSVAGRAMLLFTVVSSIATFAAISQQRDQYFDGFFSGIAGLAPAASAKGAEVLAGAIDNYAVSQASAESLFPRSAVRAQLQSSVAGFGLLSADQQEALIDQTYAAVLLPQVEKLKEGAAQSMRDFAANPPQMDAAAVETLRAQLSSSDAYKQLYSYFPLGIALLVLSVLSMLSFPAKLLAAILAFAGFRLV